MTAVSLQNNNGINHSYCLLESLDLPSFDVQESKDPPEETSTGRGAIQRSGYVAAS